MTKDAKVLSKRINAIFILFALAQVGCEGALAADAKSQYTGTIAPIAVAGAGQLSCLAAFQPDQDAATFNWVMGFWTGMNAAREAQVGSATDANGIMEQVRLGCSTHPSSRLFDAAVKAYIFFAKG